MYLRQLRNNRLYYLLYYVWKSTNYGVLEGLASFNLANPYRMSQNHTILYKSFPLVQLLLSQLLKIFCLPMLFSSLSIQFLKFPILILPSFTIVLVLLTRCVGLSSPRVWDSGFEPGRLFLLISLVKWYSAYLWMNIRVYLQLHLY